MSALPVAAAAVLMRGCLCWVMGRGERDRACPVRPVPPLHGDTSTAETGTGLSPAELRAAVRLMGLYREAAADLVAQEEAAEARRAAAAPAPTSHLEVA